MDVKGVGGFRLTRPRKRKALEEIYFNFHPSEAEK